MKSDNTCNIVPLRTREDTENLQKDLFLNYFSLQHRLLDSIISDYSFLINSEQLQHQFIKWHETRKQIIEFATVNEKSLPKLKSIDCDQLVKEHSLFSQRGNQQNKVTPLNTLLRIRKQGDFLFHELDRQQQSLLNFIESTHGDFIKDHPLLNQEFKRCQDAWDRLKIFSSAHSRAWQILSMDLSIE